MLSIIFICLLLKTLISSLVNGQWSLFFSCKDYPNRIYLSLENQYKPYENSLVYLYPRYQWDFELFIHFFHFSSIIQSRNCTCNWYCISIYAELPCICWFRVLLKILLLKIFPTQLKSQTTKNCTAA